jgi:hypothetical protein
LFPPETSDLICPETTHDSPKPAKLQKNRSDLAGAVASAAEMRLQESRTGIKFNVTFAPRRSALIPAFGFPPRSIPQSVKKKVYDEKGRKLR